MTAEGGVVELGVVIAAAPGEVWRALVEPAINERWMGGHRMTPSGEVGGPFVIAEQLNGRDNAETGTVLAFEAPTLLRYEHWSRLWRVPDRPENRAVMTIRLVPEGEGTRVEMRHELPVVEAIVPHSRFYWSVSLELLRKLLEGGARF